MGEHLSHGQGPRRREAPGAGAVFTSLVSCTFRWSGSSCCSTTGRRCRGLRHSHQLLPRHARLLRYCSAGSSFSPAPRELFPCNDRNSTTAIAECLQSPLQKLWSWLTRDLVCVERHGGSDMDGQFLGGSVLADGELAESTVAVGVGQSVRFPRPSGGKIPRYRDRGFDVGSRIDRGCREYRHGAGHREVVQQ